MSVRNSSAFMQVAAFACVAFFATAGERANAADLWATATGHHTVTSIVNADTRRFAAISHDNRRALTASGKTNVSSLWDVSSGNILQVLIAEADIHHVSFLPAGIPITGLSDGRIIFWHPLAGEPIRQIETKSANSFFAISKDGTRSVVVSISGDVTVWNAVTGEQESKFDASRGRRYEFTGFSINDEGTRALLTRSKQASLWDVRSGTLIHDFTSSNLHISDLSADGKVVVTGSHSKKASLWNADSGELIRELVIPRTNGSTRLFKLNRAGTLLLMGRYGGAASIFRVDTNQFAHRLVGHEASIVGIEFSPDDSRIITMSTDQTAAVWDTETGKRRQQMTSPAAHVERIRSNPAGTELVVQSTGCLALWNVSDGKLQTIARGFKKCSSLQASRNLDTVVARRR